MGQSFERNKQLTRDTMTTIQFLFSYILLNLIQYIIDLIFRIITSSTLVFESWSNSL